MPSSEDRATEQVHTPELASVFVQIGLVPNSQFLQGVVQLSPHGEVVIHMKGQTSEAGIFAAGDVTTVPFKQIITSMGEGAKAALAAFEYLMLNPLEDTAEQAAWPAFLTGIPDAGAGRVCPAAVLELKSGRARTSRAGIGRIH